MSCTIEPFFTDYARDGVYTLRERLRLIAEALMIEAGSVKNDQQAMRETVNLLIDSVPAHRCKEYRANELTLVEGLGDGSVYSASDFAGRINNQFGIKEKLQLIGAMWEVAYASGELARRDEYLIQHVSELICVSREDCLRKRYFTSLRLASSVAAECKIVDINWVRGCANSK